MGAWFWFLWIVVGIVVVSFLGLRYTRRTCMLAFGKGYTDASSVPWNHVEENYRSYLRPMRPMDAAAYTRGLEYCLNCGTGDWQDLKRDFVDAWKSGAITREGTAIRRMGAQAAASKLSLRIPVELEALIRRNPAYPPLAVKMGIASSE